MIRLLPTLVLGLALLAPCSAAAQQEQPGEQTAAAGSDQDLAKQLANPVADLVSVPLQFD